MEYSIEQLREIVELAKRKHYDELEEKFLELAEDPPAEMRFYDSMARALLKNDARDRLTELFSVTAGALVAKGRAGEAVGVVRTAWRYAPGLGGLAETLIEALKALYGNRPSFKQYLTAAGLDQRADLHRALERFEEFLYCDVGEVFEHQTFGIGIVEEIEPERRRVSIRFPGKAPKEFTFEGVRDFLKKHATGGFRAERMRDREALKRRAAEAPAEFLRFVLQGFPDELSQVDLKNLLLEDFFSREEWDQWWAANRRAIRRDPYIDWGRGGRAVLRLRTEPKTYYDAMAEEFRENDSAGARLAMIAEMAKHIKDEPPPEGLARDLIEALQTELAYLDENDRAGQYERVCLAREIVRSLGGAEMPAGFDEQAIITQADDPGRLILNLSAQEFQCWAVEALTAADPARATDVCARMLPDASSRLAQWLIERLIAHGEIAAISAAFQKALRSPSRNPELFLWTARQFFADKYAALSLDIAPHEVILAMADFIKDLQNQVERGVPNASTLRGIVVRLKNFLADDHYAILRHAITPLPVDEARAVCRAFESHAAFPDSYLASLRHAAQEVRPDIEETAEAISPADIDPSVLYVTVESLQKRQGELQHLRSVEIPKNSREIGEAASLGDLSENAEYEAARHRQRILFKRAEELQRDLERARRIDPSWIRTDCVWVATRFQARNVRTSEVVTYTILGAWDGRPEENVLSYLTPAAAQFLHKRVGERVVVQRPNTEPIEFEILQIENVLT